MSAAPRRLLLIRTFVELKGGGPVPPVGLLYLAAMVRRELGQRWEVDLLDTGLGPLSVEEVAARAEAYGPDVVGLSAMSCEAPWLHQLTAALRPALPGAWIVVGGPHAMTAAERVMEDPAVDLVVPGEGEQTLVELLRAREAGTPPSEVPGLVYRRGEAAVRSPARPMVADLDSLPLPAWDLVDLDAYGRQPNWNGVKMEPRYAAVVTSRGCPYRCIFCHNIFGRKVRRRSAKSVVAEILRLNEELGVREFHVLDDIFNVDHERAAAICTGLIESGRKLWLSFPNGLRADRMTPELIDLLVRAGTYKVNFGFETAVPRLQELTQKKLDIPKAREMIALTARTRIITGAYFMLGLPSETREEMEQTIDFAVSSPLDVAYFFKATSYPGTVFYQQQAEAHGEGAAAGTPAEQEFGEYHFFSVERSHSEVPAEQLNAAMLSAQQRFFLRPRRLWRAFRKWPSKLEYLRNLLQLSGLLLQGYIVRKLLAAADKKQAKALPPAGEGGEGR